MKRTVLIFIVISIIFMLISILMAGGGHGSPIPAIILTPTVLLTLTASGVGEYVVYVLATLILFTGYGIFVGRLRHRLIFALILLTLFHSFLIWLVVYILNGWGKFD